MRRPLVAWWLGIALFAVGILAGIQHARTAEGLAALGGIAIVLLAGLAAAVVTGAACAWSARRDPLHPAYLAVTTLLGFTAAFFGVWLGLDAPSPFMAAMTVGGLISLVGPATAWRARRDI